MTQKSIETMAEEYSSQFYGLPEDHSMRDFTAGFSACLEALNEVPEQKYAYHPKSECTDGSFDCWPLDSGEKVSDEHRILVEAIPVAARIKALESDLAKSDENCKRIIQLDIDRCREYETQIAMLTTDHKTKLAVVKFSELDEGNKELIMKLMAVLAQIKGEA